MIAEIVKAKVIDQPLNRCIWKHAISSPYFHLAPLQTSHKFLLNFILYCKDLKFSCMYRVSNIYDRVCIDIHDTRRFHVLCTKLWSGWIVVNRLHCLDCITIICPYCRVDQRGGGAERKAPTTNFSCPSTPRLITL